MSPIASSVLGACLFAGAAIALPSASSGPKEGGSARQNGWDISSFKSLVTFGDSYTDEGRLGYFGGHNYTAPPPGYIVPPSSSTSTGGRIWPRYVSDYSGATLYDYAVSGAVCSNEITPRVWQDNFDFPSVIDYEVPAFLTDLNFVNATTHKKAINVPADETVYAMWIGTNDLGNGAFLTDSQIQNKTIVDYLDCVYSALDELYKAGGRYFVVMNIAPLNLAPQYALPQDGGLKATRYFPTKATLNTTDVSFRMEEEVALVNDAYMYRTLYFVSQDRYKDAAFAVFNVHDLMTDIYYNPSAYLNGTAPLNVTGIVDQPTNGNYTNGPYKAASSPDSFMWYDELHPSEQTDRVIAREFVNVVKGTSKYALYWS